jgi:hypothetical protein
MRSGGGSRRKGESSGVGQCMIRIEGCNKRYNIVFGHDPAVFTVYNVKACVAFGIKFLVDGLCYIQVPQHGHAITWEN